jgi:hypothetical protein
MDLTRFYVLPVVPVPGVESAARSEVVDGLDRTLPGSSASRF